LSYPVNCCIFATLKNKMHLRSFFFDLGDCQRVDEMANSTFPRRAGLYKNDMLMPS